MEVARQSYEQRIAEMPGQEAEAVGLCLSHFTHCTSVSVSVKLGRMVLMSVMQHSGLKVSTKKTPYNLLSPINVFGAP